MNRQYNVLNLFGILGFSFIALFPNQGSGQMPVISVGQDVNISESAAGSFIEPATEVIMEVNPLNPKHLVAMANSGSFLYYSLDGGMNWRNIEINDVRDNNNCKLLPKLLVTGPASFHTDPSLTFDDQGTLYAATGNLDQNLLWICRFENGAFASNPVRATRCAEITARDKWHIGSGPAPAPLGPRPNRMFTRHKLEQPESR